MRYCILIVLLFISLPVSAQNAPFTQADVKDQGVLVHNITIQGFVLGDKDQFVKLFKPYRNKYLSADKIDAILQQLKKIYEREGYQELVSIDYQLDKRTLTFTVTLIE